MYSMLDHQTVSDKFHCQGRSNSPRYCRWYACLTTPSQTQCCHCTSFFPLHYCDDLCASLVLFILTTKSRGSKNSTHSKNVTFIYIESVSHVLNIHIQRIKQRSGESIFMWSDTHRLITTCFTQKWECRCCSIPLWINLNLLGKKYLTWILMPFCSL